MELKEAIFGHHNLAVWLGTVVWTVIILFTYKLNKAPNLKSGFKWRFFLNDNLLDFIFNILLSVITLRAGDGFIHSLYSFLNEKVLSGFDFNLDADSMDIVIAVSFIVLPLSYWLHKKRKPVVSSVTKEMHVQNEKCKHL